VSEAAHAEVSDGLAARGFAVVSEFLPRTDVAALRAEAERHRAAGEFRPARVGRGASAERDARLRGDSIRWLGAEHASAPERALLARLGALRGALNRALFLGLVELEAHYALYPPGAGYTRHLDRFRDDDARAVSLVLYLNDGWRAEDGGALQLFAAEHDVEPRREIAPCGGTLVALRSEGIWHAVAPARRERWSVAGWLRRRA
jgi:SM-20-related protein